MQKAHDASKNNWWENLPSIATPIVAEELNRNETSVDTIDDRVVTFDTTKANQSDLLLAVKSISFNKNTGVFTITKFNNTSATIDTDIEKIAINFDYDDDPTSAHYQNLVITLDDGTVKYVDMSALVTQYDFSDSAQIHFTNTSGTISATIINGSITEEKLQPNFLADCRAAKTAAETAEAHAQSSEEDSEAWAVGERNGVPVPSTDETYHNNAKYWASQANVTSLVALTDVDINYPKSGEVLTFNGDKWENREFFSPEDITVADSFESYTGGKVKSVQMELSPNQDLHGYDSPWVGGAGKNLLFMTVDSIKANNTISTWSGNAYTIDGVKFEILADNADNVLGIKVTRVSASSNNVVFNITNGSELSGLNGKSLIINDSGTGASVDMFTQFYLYDGTNVISPPIGGDSSVFTATPSASSKFRIVVRTASNPNGVTFVPMIRLSSVTDATFAPYSNICPISGHTQVEVGDDGKNRFNPSTCVLNKYIDDDGTIGNANGFMYSQPICVKEGSYKFSGSYSGSGSYSVRILGYDKDDNFVSLLGRQGGSASQRVINVDATVTSGIKFVRLSLPQAIDEPQLELGSTKTAYVPYNGYQVTVNLGGTYYSGTLDVVTGVFTPDTASDDLGSLTWQTRYTGSVNKTLSSSLSQKPLWAETAGEVQCEDYKYNGKVSGASILSDPDNCEVGFYLYYSQGQEGNAKVCYLVIPVDSSPDGKVVYELNDTIPINLDPQLIEAFLGENNFSAPLEQQEIIEIIARNIAEFNEVIDDENISEDFTYSSEKIEDRLDEYVDKDAVEEKSATTEFETINGGLLSSLKVALSPNQDLHGYAEPWVGGAGKNKFNKNGNLENGKFIQADGTLVSSTNWNTTDYQQITPDTYTMSGATEGEGGYYGICWYDSGKTYISGFQRFTTSPQTVTIPSNAQYVRYCVNNSALDSFMLEQGSVATAYEPYENICPISGHTQSEVDVSDGQTTQEQVTVNLGGTYYSGTLDVVTGVFVPDTASVDLGTLTWSLTAQGYMNGTGIGSLVKKPASSSDVANIICSALKTVSAFNIYSGGEGIGIHISGEVRVRYDGMSTDVPTFTSAMSGVQLVYELATPTPIQLSPTMVKALVGENHLSAPLDGQDITESKYRELFTWDEVSGVTDSLDSRVDTLETNASKITWSSSVSKAIDDTTCTIQDPKITTSSIIEPFYSNASGDNVVIKNQIATAGQVVLTFDALLEATSFRVRITNL